jgi:hypothetical protein
VRSVDDPVQMLVLTSGSEAEPLADR